MFDTFNAEDLAEAAVLYVTKPRTRGGLELDATEDAEWFNWEAGQRKRVKRGMNRRSRRSVRQILASAY
jgi:hypothetical protein